MTDSADRARILHTDTVRVASRFNGPPGLGQGGYSAWLAAQPLEGAAATVAAGAALWVVVLPKV